MTNVEKIAVQRFGQDGLKLINEVVAKECLVHIQMNDKRVSSLLASPEDLIDLALGHLAVEHGCRPAPSDIDASLTADNEEYTVIIRAETSIELTSRPTIVTSSCGACDHQNLDDLVKRTPAVDDHELPVSLQTIIQALHDLRMQQPGFQETGGMHAAGLYFGPESPSIVREDIGRHNAVDKVLGHKLTTRPIDKPLALLLSGRCGWDIVSKAAHMNIPVIASIGAASSLAVEAARASNMTLISFAKLDKAVVIGPVEGRFQRNH